VTRPAPAAGPVPRVVIIGAGFGGLAAARALADAAVEITVVDRDNYHGFWPLLYQVATANLGADDIARPVRAELAEARNTTVRMATVTGVDLDRRAVHLEGQPDLDYDHLIVSAGSVSNDFGIPGVADGTFPLKTLPDALRLRNHLLSAFEQAAGRVAEGEPESSATAAQTIVLVGAGPTGVEMAGALSELISHNLSHDFPQLDMSRSRVVLVEMVDRLLPGFSQQAGDAARRSLLDKGVELRLRTSLKSVDGDRVTLDDGSTLDACTVVWTAGVAASPLAGRLQGGSGPVAQGRAGRVEVAPDLSVPGHPEVFVIGDAAAATDRHGDLLPQVAQVAIQGGRHAAHSIERRVAGRGTKAFRYHDHGMMATIGRRSAVADLPGGLHFRGTIGWLAWLLVHLVFLVGFRNRVTVLINWAINYVTWERASRIILDEDAPRGQPDAKG
jgi:NADH dehydrogenase